MLGNIRDRPRQKFTISLIKHVKCIKKELEEGKPTIRKFREYLLYPAMRGTCYFASIWRACRNSPLPGLPDGRIISYWAPCVNHLKNQILHFLHVCQNSNHVHCINGNGRCTWCSYQNGTHAELFRPYSAMLAPLVRTQT